MPWCHWPPGRDRVLFCMSQPLGGGGGEGKGSLAWILSVTLPRDVSSLHFSIPERVLLKSPGPGMRRALAARPCGHKPRRGLSLATLSETVWGAGPPRPRPWRRAARAWNIRYHEPLTSWSLPPLGPGPSSQLRISTHLPRSPPSRGQNPVSPLPSLVFWSVKGLHRFQNAAGRARIHPCFAHPSAVLQKPPDEE